MPILSRRNLLKTGAALAAGAQTRAVDASVRAGVRYNHGHTVDFGEQYYSNMLGILESVRRTEMERIGNISERMAAVLKKGGAVWWQAKAGHMPLYEFREENKGNPRIFRTWLRAGSGGDYENMKPGDVLVTNYVHHDIAAARDRGVHVVGVPVNYVDNEWAPRGFVTPNENGLLLGDVTNEILRSYIPYTQGIVDCPQIPEMRICPSSANSLGALFWMHQAETANILGNPGAKHPDKSVVFMDTLLGRIREAYHTQKDLLFDYAPEAAKKIGSGAHIHITSDHQGVEIEATVVAMGPMMFNAHRKEMKRGDVHILATIDPDSDAILAEAKRAREMNMFVVSIAPGSSAELRRLSDVFVDNFCPEGQGFFAIPGYDEKIGTMGGIVNNTLFWIFSAQMIDEMVRRGWVPYFWMGIYTVGGSRYNAAMQPFFRKRGF